VSRLSHNSYQQLIELAIKAHYYLIKVLVITSENKEEFTDTINIKLNGYKNEIKALDIFRVMFPNILT
jgi:uncharacterized HAD superfamily protein